MTFLGKLHPLQAIREHFEGTADEIKKCYLSPPAKPPPYDSRFPQLQHPQRRASDYQTGFAGLTPTTFSGTLTIIAGRPLSYLPNVTVSFTCRQGFTCTDNSTRIWEEWTNRTTSIYRLDVEAQPIPFEFTHHSYIPEGGALEYNFEITLSDFDTLPDSHQWVNELDRLHCAVKYQLEAVVKSKNGYQNAKVSADIPFTFYHPIILTPPADRPPIGWFENEPLGFGLPYERHSTTTDLRKFPKFPFLLDLSFTSGIYWNFDTNPTISFRLTPKQSTTAHIKSVKFILTQFARHCEAIIDTREVLHKELKNDKHSNAIVLGEYQDLEIPLALAGWAAPTIKKGSCADYEVAHVFECVVETKDGWIEHTKWGAKCLVELSRAKLGELRRAGLLAY
ncbi:hypothetical protein HDV00_004533 [Rhizophlyctis rosea]|nr:hypothetical protein HDV00_004533 [Rhizophlyctis rosea]